jgi:hypothetical protein
MSMPTVVLARCCLLMLASLLTLAASPAAAQDLEQTLERVAAAWHKGDAGAITALAARSGVSLDVDGRSVGPLGPRQAAAGIRRVFEDRESVAARSNMTRVVGGAPPRAFGEITWASRARGTTIPERATIFVALVREDDRWRITEIRLIR